VSESTSDCALLTLSCRQTAATRDGHSELASGAGGQRATPLAQSAESEPGRVRISGAVQQPLVSIARPRAGSADSRTARRRGLHRARGHVLGGCRSPLPVGGLWSGQDG